MRSEKLVPVGGGSRPSKKCCRLPPLNFEVSSSSRTALNLCKRVSVASARRIWISISFCKPSTLAVSSDIFQSTIGCLLDMVPTFASKLCTTWSKIWLLCSCNRASCFVHLSSNSATSRRAMANGSRISTPLPRPMKWLSRGVDRQLNALLGEINPPGTSAGGRKPCFGADIDTPGAASASAPARRLLNLESFASPLGDQPAHFGRSTSGALVLAAVQAWPLSIG
mmetsp:Transcript_47015/g.151039  ORF Transcript_47015/g.151039 Transcript_47015/m.151039 type:complete len:225 (+) Transcript_47015:1464-2138(+)